jgi:hypothetical protein
MVWRRERSDVPFATNTPQKERPPRGGLSEIRSGVLLALMTEANSKLVCLLA